jgi:multiple sugar transport system substrate-binding protein
MGTTAAGLAGVLQTRVPPLYAAERTLTMLTWEHFIQAANDNLQQMAQLFGRSSRCQVKIDFIPHRDTYVKAGQEQQIRRGHDIVFLFYGLPQQYNEDLETLDFMEDLGKRLGGWYDIAREVGQAQGRWVALPWYCAAQCITYREDLYRQHHLEIPQTWEAWKETAKHIKAANNTYKAGLTLSETEDSNLTLYALLWSYGTSTVDAKGRVVINSRATRQAMDYIKEFYECCMTSDVLHWDDSSNNSAFLSGEYIWVHNGTSIYGAAKKKAPEIFAVTNHALIPVGPHGQHGTATPNNYGIWRFAKEKALAKEFLQYIMDLKRLEINFYATSTYNTPLCKAAEQFDWQRDPKTTKLKDFMKTAHMMGWPAPADLRAEQARAKWIVPNMFKSYVTGKKSLEEAVAWGEAELQQIYKA